MSYDFPGGPTVGQQVIMADGTLRAWDGAKWKAAPAPGASGPSSGTPQSTRVTTNLTPVSYPGAVTSEQDLQSVSVNGALLSADGMAFRIKVTGTVPNLAAVRNVRLYFGGTQVGLIQPASGGPFNWFIDCLVTRTGASAEYSTAMGLYTTDGSPGTSTTTYYRTPAVSLSGSVIIKTTGQSTLAGAGAVVSSMIMVELL